MPPLAIHGQRLAGRHPDGVGHGHECTAQIAHFLLEQAYARGQFVRAERVGADQLRQFGHDMSGRVAQRFLFHKGDGNAMAGEVQRALATGQAATDNGDAGLLHEGTFQHGS